MELLHSALKRHSRGNKRWRHHCRLFSQASLTVITEFLTLTDIKTGSLGRSGREAGKGRKACNYASGIYISASKKSMRNAERRR